MGEGIEVLVAGRPAPEPPARGDRAAPGHDRWLFPAALVLAALPFVAIAAGLIVAVGGDYHPAGDLAMTEVHTRDIGRHEVLTGLHSRWNWSHPGPLQFYVSAPIYRLSGSAAIGMLLAGLAVNLAAVVGSLVIARRRGGTALVLCTLLGCLLLERTLGPGFLADNYNLTLTVFPFVLLAFVAWSIWAGETWAIPVGAFVASFLVQTHVAFLALAVPLYGLGLAGLAVRLARARRAERSGTAGDTAGDRGPDPGGPAGDALPSRRALVRSGAAGAGLLAVVWLPPVLDALLHEPSNLGNMWRYFRDPIEPTHSLAEGWRVAIGQFAAKPEWLTGKLPSFAFSGESPFLYRAPAPWLGLVAAAAAAVAWRLSREARRLAVIVGVSVASVVVSVMRTAGLVQDYRLRYTWAPPMLAAVLVLWALWLLASRRAPAAGPVAAGVVVTGAAVLSVVTAVSGARMGTPHEDDSAVVETLSAPLLARYGDADDPLLFDDLMTLAGPWYSRGIVLELERHGIEAEVDARMRHPYARHQVHDGGPVEDRILVASNEDVPPLLDEPGLELVSRWLAVPADRQDELTAALDDLSDQLAAGTVTEAGYVSSSQALVSDLMGDDRPDTVATDVAVFVDHRPVADA